MNETQRALRDPAGGGEGLGMTVAARMVATQGPSSVEPPSQGEMGANFAVPVDIIRECHARNLKDIALLSVEQVQRLEDFVLGQLNDPSWDWRTIAGLQRSAHVPEGLILSIIQRNTDRIERVHSKQHGLLVRPVGRKISHPRSFLDAVDRVLDYVSFGKRRTSSS